jgi:pilus assembly protein CpaB
MGRRTVLLIAALVVAALGTAMVFLYVNNVEQNAVGDQTLVEVLVASSDIAAGTTGAAAAEAGAFETVKIPDVTVPDGAISDPSAISDLVALAPVFTGQVILTQMFGNPSAEGGLSIPKGAMAVSVELGDPNRVAGFVAPGSQVAVFVTLEDEAGNPKTQLLLDRAQVIAVGPSTVTTTTTTDQSGSQNTEEISRAILTLALTQQDSQKLIFGQSQGPLYFGLLSADSSVKQGSPTDSGNLFVR